MALQTKTFTVGGTLSDEYARFALELQLTEESVNVADNTSTVSYRLRLHSGIYYFSLYVMGAEVRLAGTQVAYRDLLTAPQVSIGKNSTFEIFNGTAVVPHNEDGTLDMAVEFSIRMAKEYYTPGPMNGSGTMALTAIPRASTVAAASAAIGQRSIYTIQRKSAAYTHSVRYSFGELTGYVGSDGVSTDTEVILSDATGSFLIPESFYSQIPNDPSGVCTLLCQTYSGTVPVGTPQSTTFTVTTDPIQCGPLVDGSVEDGNPVTLALTGDAQRLVKFLSDAKCTVTASARCGAQLTEITVNGVPIDGEQTLAGVETGSFVFRACDSRGYEVKKEITLALIEYIKLTANVTASRKGPTSNEAVLRFEGAYFGSSFGAQNNALTVRFRVADGAWQTVEPVPGENSYAAEVTVPELDYQQSHILETEVCDCLMCVQKSVTVLQGVPVFDWGQKDFVFHVPVECEQSVNALFFRRGKPDSAGVLRLQSRYEAFTGAGYSRQPIFLFGDRIWGVAEVVNNGQCYWWGSEGVTVTTEAGGILVVDVPTPVQSAYGILSPDSITVL